MNNLIYEESYIGLSTTENIICVNPVIHRLVLTDSAGDGWSFDSKLVISTESGVLGEFTLSSGSSTTVLIHPILGQVIGMIDETIITNCSELDTIPSNATSLFIDNSACNFDSITKLNLTNTGSLQSIEIGSDSFMFVNVFVIDGLNELKSLRVEMNSFTYVKSSDNEWDDYRVNNKSRSFSILNCIELESIDISEFSFCDYAGGFELRNLPKLSTIKIGEIGSDSSNFFYSSFEIKGIIDMILLMNRSSTFEFH